MLADPPFSEGEGGSRQQVAVKTRGVCRVTSRADLAVGVGVEAQPSIGFSEVIKDMDTSMRVSGLQND